MKKNLLLCLFICFCYQSYSQINNWMISSEISPMSRSGNERVLNNPSGLNLEWRNRVGFKLGEQTMMGLSASYRHYNIKEIYYIIPPFPSAYQYKLNNQLFGIGAFLTQYYHVAPRFHLQTSGYMQVEQGKGNYQITSPGHDGTPYSGAGTAYPPSLHENSTFRERNFFAGLEFGASYFLTQRWILQTNINLLQYENFRNTYADINIYNDVYQDPQAFRPLEQEGSGFSFLTDRPFFHLGVMVLLGKN